MKSLLKIETEEKNSPFFTSGGGFLQLVNPDQVFPENQVSLGDRDLQIFESGRLLAIDIVTPAAGKDGGIGAEQEPPRQWPVLLLVTGYWLLATGN